MTAETPNTYASDLAELSKVTAKVERARAHLAALEAEAAAQIAKTLKSCIAEGHNRTEVLKHSPFSAPKVRAIGEDAGIPPDERYVRAVKGKTEG